MPTLETKLNGGSWIWGGAVVLPYISPRWRYHLKRIQACSNPRKKNDITQTLEGKTFASCNISVENSEWSGGGEGGEDEDLGLLQEFHFVLVMNKTSLRRFSLPRLLQASLFLYPFFFFFFLFKDKGFSGKSCSLHSVLISAYTTKKAPAVDATEKCCKKETRERKKSQFFEFIIGPFRESLCVITLF